MSDTYTGHRAGSVARLALFLSAGCGEIESDIRKIKERGEAEPCGLWEWWVQRSKVCVCVCAG